MLVTTPKPRSFLTIEPCIPYQNAYMLLVFTESKCENIGYVGRESARARHVVGGDSTAEPIAVIRTITLNEYIASGRKTLRFLNDRAPCNLSFLQLLATYITF